MKLVPRLMDGDLERLEESIKKDGFWGHLPIIANKKGVILDGHHRYEICNKLHVEPAVKTVSFDNPDTEEPLFILNNTLKRRHLTPMQRIEMARNATEFFQKIARERMKIGAINSNMNNKKPGKPHDGSSGLGYQISDNPLDDQNVHTLKEVAKLANCSHDTVHKVNTIFEKGTDEQKENVRNGKTTINHAYQSIMNKKKHTETPDLPAGEYDIIYADPPWEYRNSSSRGSAANHYSTMPTEKIAAMKVPAAEDAMLFLWGTIPNLEAALHVIESWGFRYVTAIAWIKSKPGTGFYVRGKFELLLIAKKGRMPIPVEYTRPENVVMSKESAHSKKPDVFYSIIERMYPNRKYLELFARNTREGWRSWGNEMKDLNEKGGTVAG